MRATGRILRVTGTGRIPRLSATARMVQGQLAPAAQLARIADAVEVHDPGGILVEAEDTDDGVRIVLAPAAEASPTPATAVGLSVPLRDVAGRRLAAASTWGPGGQCILDVVTPPADVAAAQGLWVYVALTEGPLSTATKGMCWGMQAMADGTWRMCMLLASGSGWGLPATPALAGAHSGVMGLPGYTAGGLVTRDIACMPRPTPLPGHGVVSGTASILPVADLHFAWGAGWAWVPTGGPQEITIRPLAALISGEM